MVKESSGESSDGEKEQGDLYKSSKVQKPSQVRTQVVFWAGFFLLGIVVTVLCVAVVAGGSPAIHFATIVYLMYFVAGYVLLLVVYLLIRIALWDFRRFK